MALSNFFKFRDLPEAETSKPFLEHLEDLRWTIVKMAITLLVAMVLCFAFRTTLVQIMQQPLHDIDPKIGEEQYRNRPCGLGCGPQFGLNLKAVHVT